MKKKGFGVDCVETKLTSFSGVNYLLSPNLCCLNHHMGTLQLAGDGFPITFNAILLIKRGREKEDIASVQIMQAY